MDSVVLEPTTEVGARQNTGNGGKKNLPSEERMRELARTDFYNTESWLAAKQTHRAVIRAY